jgi:uncharacterized protein
LTFASEAGTIQVLAQSAACQLAICRVAATSAIHRSAERRKRGMVSGESLATLLGRLQVAGNIDLAAVASSDGFLLESAQVAGIDAEEIITVATNGLMVAMAIGREIARGAIDTAIFEYSDGTVMLAALDEELVLVLLAGPGTNLGRLRLFAHRYRDELIAAASVK